MRPVERFSLTCQTWRNYINRKCFICLGVISIKSYILWSLIERFVAISLFLFNRHSSTHCIKGCLVSLKIGDCPLFGNENTCPVMNSNTYFCCRRNIKCTTSETLREPLYQIIISSHPVETAHQNTPAAPVSTFRSRCDPQIKTFLHLWANRCHPVLQCHFSVPQVCVCSIAVASSPPVCVCCPDSPCQSCLCHH